MKNIRLQEWKEKCRNINILIIGDPILDIYIKGINTRFCREAPIPVFSVQQEEYVCGGAANTCVNVSSLGANVFFISCIGNDKNSHLLLDTLTQKKVHTSFITSQDDRRLCCKKRYVSDNSVLFRTDEGDSFEINTTSENILKDNIQASWDRTDIIILSDYNLGIFTNGIIETISSLQKIKPKKIIIDAHQPSKFSKINPYAVKPNYIESAQTLLLPVMEKEDRIKQIIENKNQLHQLLATEIICQTLDRSGAILFQKNKEPIHLRSTPVQNIRTIGVGDSFTAAFALSIALGLSPEDSIEIAHTASSIVLKKDKTAICHADELLAELNRFPKYIKEHNHLFLKIEEKRKLGNKIVFTNGCFDIIHKGHVSLFKEAKTHGDILVVAVNGDESIQKIKGKNRPINTLEDRLSVLSSIEDIDFLTSFENITSEKLIRLIQPDVFVKGSSYLNKSIPETEAIKETGGKVCILHSPSYSTTDIINRILHWV